MLLNLQRTYIHLAEDGVATQLPGGEEFWSMPEAEIDRYGDGWLVSEFEFAADWPNWEMHPNADEFVYLLSGSVEVHLERADGLQKVALTGSGALVVPRAVWHTAKVTEPAVCFMSRAAPVLNCVLHSKVTPNPSFKRTRLRRSA